ncbi:MAG: Rieske (2Fe-2S) protein [Synechococcaceae cyanobacterium ELA739]
MRRRTFLLFSSAGALLGQMLNPLLGRSAQLPVPSRRQALDPSTLLEQGPAVDHPIAQARNLDVASVAELNKKGAVLIPNSPLGPVLVIRDRATGQLKAVNPTCPHRGCTVDWNRSSDNFLCPCHQARFNADGRWIGGKPVPRPLERFKVTVANGRILVSPA